MNPLIQQVALTFTQSKWAHQMVEDADVIEAGFEAHHTRVMLHVQAFPDLNAVSVVSQSPIRAQDPDHRVKTAELLMRVNERLTVGNFEMRWDTGETVFRVTNIFPRGQFDPVILKGLVQSVVVEMDRITPCLTVVQNASSVDLLILDLEQLIRRQDLLPGDPVS